jgi:nucleotide-binding universal stress UspA family protein
MIVRPQNAKRLRGKKQVFNNILISLDGSELSKRALPVGEALAAGLKIPITLFEMVPMVYPSANVSNM